MISENRIRQLLEEKIADTNLFLVDVSVKPGNRIIVEIDSDKGITIDECVSINRYLEQQLDREEQDFDLKVSSPGLDQPLRTQKQYLKNKGRKISVLTKDGLKYEGILQEADEENIQLLTKSREKQEGKKGKITVERVVPIPISNIKEAKIIVIINK